ncbi:MAG: hydroxymethylpyrimidine kinase/phosphomethylpyrimidine kinase/thiamine-phosphate diphosphorylase [Colwellia sp.]|jgi:hydroxymethylpyrimidine kinase/phosphomethylpyrimidine kinase/thiamine-phosphate diphosphorylase
MKTEQQVPIKPIIWTISGSDCSGGAGIAADIKTGHALGVEVCHLITANTVQNSQQLLSVNAISVDILQQQATVLIDDKPPSVIKIGLVANVEQVLWLAKLLEQYKQLMPNLISVYDPVGQASVGGNFSTMTLDQLSPLLRQVDVITPNLLEAKHLARFADSIDKNHQNVTAVEVLAKHIHQNFAISAIIIKGGHSADEQSSSDYCYHQLNQLHGKQDNQDKSQTAISYQLSTKRIESHYSHGGGCSFATALSAFFAQGYLVRDAFTLAKAFISQGLAASEQVSQSFGHQYYGAFEQQGWPRESQHFSEVVDPLNIEYKNLTTFKSLNLAGKKLGLYPVIDSLYWLKRLLPLGLEIIQLRVKNLVESELEHIIIDAVKLAKDYHTRLFINDYWQLAIKHGAYGVHIGQEDLQDADLSTIQQSGIRLGISTHGCYEFLLAQQLQPSYLAIGAIFSTKTKDMTGQIQGLDNLRQVLALRPEKIRLQTPVVAIGGINLERAAEVVATGVESIAVVTALTEAESSHGISAEQAVDKLQAMINY